MKAFAAGLLATALYAAPSSANPIKACPNDICFHVAVPQEAASTGNGNLYFQMSAPSKYQWVALGTGSSMTSSNMFIMYTDGSGNLTISPRTASGYTMPTLSPTTELKLLEGSGIVDGKMVANVLCTNCATWSSGSMTFNSPSTSWISAWKSGSPINSVSASEVISRHDGHANFDLDLTKATVQSDSNPFLNGGGDGNGSGGSTSGGVVFNAGDKSKLILAHGIIMSMVFIFFYPVGSLLLPIVGKWMAHAAWQSTAFFLMWVGFGTGYVFARDNGFLFAQTHTVLGTVVVCMLIIQPLLGVAHHKYYVKHQARGAVSYAHIWYGRILMMIGIINGGIGLNLAQSSQTFVVAYAVIAVIVGAAWVGTSTWAEVRRTQAATRVQSSGSLDSQQRIPYRQDK